MESDTPEESFGQQAMTHAPRLVTKKLSKKIFVINSYLSTIADQHGRNIFAS